MDGVKKRYVDNKPDQKIVYTFERHILLTIKAIYQKDYIENMEVKLPTRVIFNSYLYGGWDRTSDASV